MSISDAMELKDAMFAALIGVSAAGASIANALGGWDAMLKLLIVLMAADLLTGWVLAAWFKKSPKSKSGKLDSEACFRGLAKKCVILIFVFVSMMLDNATGANYVRSAVCLFYAGNEGLSLLENVGLMGVEYPSIVRNMLEAMRENGDGAQKNGGGGDD